MLTFTFPRSRRALRAGPAVRSLATHRRPVLEGLEDRCLLSNTVINFDGLPAGTAGLAPAPHVAGPAPTHVGPALIHSAQQVSPEQASPIDQLVGTWKNVDPNTGGITTLDIRVSGDMVTVHAWGKCYPTDCDWGTVQATAYAPSVGGVLPRDAHALVAVFTFPFKESLLVIDAEEGNRLRVEDLSRFTDNSGRAAYSTTDTFSRNPTIDVSAAQQHTLDVINQYRAQANAPALKLDAALNNFAYAASQDLMNTHIPHNYSNTHGNPYWETQGYQDGVPIVGWPNAPDLNATIDQILEQMMAEPLPPPGGFNHHSIIIDPAHTQLGVGLIVDSVNGTLYFTSDFTP